MEFDELMKGQTVISAATPEEKAERREVGWALDEAYWEELGRSYGGMAANVILETRRTLEPRFGTALFSGEFEVIVEPSGMVGLEMRDAAAPDNPHIAHYGHLNESQSKFRDDFARRIQNDFAKRVMAASQERYVKWVQTQADTHS